MQVWRMRFCKKIEYLVQGLYFCRLNYRMKLHKYSHFRLVLFLIGLQYFFTFSSDAQNYGDCDSAYWVGVNYRLHFDGLAGQGHKVDEAGFVDCFMNGENYGQAEVNSIWLKFRIDQPGMLVFSITPDTLTDDYDFVLFRLSENGDCSKKIIVRCMAAGDSPERPESPCLGPTGLRFGEKDESEDSGCSARGDNNWLKPLEVTANEQYALLVSNVTSPLNGFEVWFKGSCSFKQSNH